MNSSKMQKRQINLFLSLLVAIITFLLLWNTWDNKETVPTPQLIPQPETKLPAVQPYTPQPTASPAPATETPASSADVGNSSQKPNPDAVQELPPDLKDQLLNPPPDLPEDLKAQLNEPPPELPDDLKAQLNAPPPPIPDDIQQSLETPPRFVTEDEVNKAPE